MARTLRIGSGSAWWGDRIEPAALNAERGELDYLCFETMAEATVSAAQVRARRDSSFPGYDTWLDDRMRNNFGLDSPPTSNAPLRGGKATLSEGGTRVPCLVVWPGRAKPGTVSDALLSSVDWYPTLLAMTGVEPKDGRQHFDGLSQVGPLLGQEPEPVAEAVHLGPELEDRLDAGQVDPGVAVQAHDRPEPPDLRRGIALDVPDPDRPDEAATLVAEQDAGGDGQALRHGIAGEDGRVHRSVSRLERPSGRVVLTRAPGAGRSGFGRRTARSGGGSRRQPTSARRP